MTRQTKALLFSALVFPGSGQIIQGRKFRGTTYLVSEVILVFLFLWKAVLAALNAMSQLEITGEIIDLNALTTVATQAVLASGPTLSRLLTLIIGIWFISLLDTWWASRTITHS